MNVWPRVAAWASVALACVVTAQAQTTISPPVPLAPAPVQLAPPPLDLAMQVSTPESIYAPPEAMAAEQAVNAGGVNFTLDVIYFSDYVFRGINRGSDDSGNMEMAGEMRFELQKLPDLFMGVFTNINDSDPISRFQEIRPYFGLELTASGPVMQASTASVGSREEPDQPRA